MHRRFIAVSICLALLLVNTIPFVTKVSAATTRLYIDPDSIIDESMVPGTSFNLTIKVSDVVNLYAYEYKIYYDRTILNCTKAARPAGHFLEPQIDLGNQFIPKWEIKNDFNATHGRIWLSCTLLAPEAARTGSGTITIVTFRVQGLGATTLPMRDTKLADNGGIGITHGSGDSFFRNTAPSLPAYIYVDPADITDPALTPCNNFTIDIKILNATDVYSFDFKLSFDPTIVEGVEIAEGTFLSSVGPTTILHSQIDNPAGFIWFSVTLTAPPGASGAGTLAAITFHVIGLGATGLTLYDTSLTDSGAQSLTHSTANGRFANVIFARLFVDPPEIIDPTIVPGDLFYLYINVENIQNLFGYEFHLGYNTAVLTCIGVMVHPVQNETKFMTKFSVDDWIGDVFVNVTYLPGANPISTSLPLTLVTMLFKVDAMGISELPLHDTKLVNSSGDPIPHETGDGFFQSVTRDVAVLNITPSKTTIYEGRTINISVVVANQGDYFNETFDITLYYETTPIATKTVHDLPIGQNATLLFTWITTGLPPCANYTMNAEAETVPYEMDLADNTFTDGKIRIKLMGDVNGDCIVDLFDLTAVALAFSSSTGDPNWNPEADLKEDGTIDIFDIVTIVVNYGRTC
jgi:hypothetical protein